jgi:hypothetical protein
MDVIASEAKQQKKGHQILAAPFFIYDLRFYFAISLSVIARSQATKQSQPMPFS